MSDIKRSSESEISIQTKEMMKMEEEKPHTNKDGQEGKEENSLLNYEYEEGDDGADWET